MKSCNAVYIIAEGGVNHNGSLDLASQLVNIAVEAGADAVKFQTFKAESLVTRNAPKADYQNDNPEIKETQYDMVKKLELGKKELRSLFEYCRTKGIQFLSTPFDMESVDFLVNLPELPLLKISSGEATNAPLLLKAAQTGKPIALSTGMCTLKEISSALGVLAFGYMKVDENPTGEGFQRALGSKIGKRLLRDRVTLLHCTTEYPAPFSEINLKAIDTLRSTFGLQVGFSDHSDGIAVSIAAVARGAMMIEKHFTLSRDLPGPDHKSSLEPGELKALVKAIRQVEQSLGSEDKGPTKSEVKNIPVVRRSLVAAREIKKGETFTVENLAIKRPGAGLSPFKYWDLLGQRAKKNFKKDDLVCL